MGKFLEWYFGEKSMKRGRLRGENSNNAPAAPPGCMSAVFQLFDFQHYVCFDPSAASADDKSFIIAHEKPKGVEAPRNSLETQEIALTDTSDEASFSPVLKKEETSSNIPPMSIKINTKIEGSSSESSYSPSTKSPNLVARLMGLDLLPLDPLASLSPSSHNHVNALRNVSSHNRMSRSLPETPRTSSERKSDADHYHDSHRFSLQIIREKVIENDENKAPSSSRYYAKQIVKQVKENVGKRRVGMDITNRVLKNIAQERRDEHLIGGTTKSKKSSKKYIKVTENHDSTLHYNPTRPRFLEHKNKPSTVTTVFNEANVSQILPKKAKQAVVSFDPQRHQQIKRQLHSAENLDKVNRKVVPRERFKSRLGRAEKSTVEIIKPCNNNRNKSFVASTSLSSRTKCFDDKKWKQIPILIDTLPQKQVANVHTSKYGSQVSITPIHKFKQEAMISKFGALCRNDDSTHGDRRLENQYITNILRFVGIDKDTQVPFPTCHPLDPSIFNHLDLVFSTVITNDVKNQLSQLRHRSNRRLIFDLVDEILMNVQQPRKDRTLTICSQKTTHCNTEVINGSSLVEKLCGEIRSYPNAKCEDLNDIDALVGNDLDQTTLEFDGKDEEGSIVLDIEKNIIESLVDEIVMLIRC